MKEKQEIVLGFFKEGLSRLEIVRRTGLNWRTVNKYVKGYRKALKEALESGRVEDGSVILSEVVEAPVYDSSSRSKRKLNEVMIAEIGKCLQENEEKVSNRQHKQQMKKVDIHFHLRSLGYDIGYTTVATFIKDLEMKKKETFIRQSYGPGDVCEFDWGEVKIRVGGKLSSYYIAVFTAAYSNFRFAVLFERQDTVSFMRSHALFFEYIEGSYGCMVYDNMKVAVKKFIGNNEKEPTEGLLKLSMYYLFRFRFCNVRKGNEKGHVERSVEYIRRKAFCRKSTESFETLEEANAHLLDVCRDLNDQPQKLKNGQTGLEMFSEEKPYLNQPVPPFECSELAQKRVDKYGTVSVYQNMYSVPEEYTGRMVDVRIYPEKIVCYGDGGKICTHRRTYGSREWNIDLDHYLKTLHRKPGAFSGSVVLKNSEADLQGLYFNYFEGNERDFIELLLYMKAKNKDVNAINAAVEEVLKAGCITVTADKIKCICDRRECPAETVSAHENDISRISSMQLAEHSALMSNGGDA